MGLRRKDNAALALLTREQTRANTTAEMGDMGAVESDDDDDPAPTGLFVPTADQQQQQRRQSATANAAANARNAAAGRDIDLPFEDPEIEEMEPTRKTFWPDEKETPRSS